MDSAQFGGYVRPGSVDTLPVVDAAVQLDEIGGVDWYDRVFDGAWEAALDADASQCLILRVAEEYGE